MNFKEAKIEDITEIDKYCGLRPCNICEAKPSSLYLYYNEAPYKIKFFTDDRACVINCYNVEAGDAFLIDSAENKIKQRLEVDAGETSEPYIDEIFGVEPDVSGLLPYCKEEDLPHYFKLQEKYYNEVLNRPLIIYPADERGLEILQSAGMLDNYEIKEDERIRDYLYDGESLRTLAGRRLSKKRNLIHQFEKEYEGRWEYRQLTLDDVPEITSLDEKWMRIRYEQGQVEDAQKYNDGFENEDTLHHEEEGMHELLRFAHYYDIVRVGGIFIDGDLEAFSVGAYSEIDKMAIIDIEKANPEIKGLFQIINSEFLLREFPDAQLVNREDDVGIENIRRAKLSYYPYGYARKYYLRQK